MKNINFYNKKIILLIVIFTQLSCSMKYKNLDELKILRGVIVMEKTNLPLRYTNIDLFVQTQPLLSMREWKKIDSTITNSLGEFVFKFYKAGNFQLRWNPENNIWPNSYEIDNFIGEKKVKIIHKRGLYKKRGKSL